jgi:hypothetical protein
MSVLFAGSAYLGEHILLQHWSGWALAVVVTAAVAFGMGLEWGLPADLRSAVKTRLTGLFQRLGHIGLRSGAQ